MYGKHFYGFEKEGKSSYYSEKQMEKGHYFVLNCPIWNDLIKHESGGLLKIFAWAI